MSISLENDSSVPQRHLLKGPTQFRSKRVCLVVIPALVLLCVLWKSLLQLPQILPGQERYTSPEISHIFLDKPTYQIPPEDLVKEISIQLSNTSFSNKRGKPYVTAMSKDEIFCGLLEKLVVPDSHYMATLPNTVIKSCKLSNSNFLQVSSRQDTVHAPRTNIAFVKVHKAASTTVQNIVLRFAFWNQLNVVLHKHKVHLKEHSHKLTEKDIVELPAGHNFNILSHHLIFNKTVISHFMPKDTVYVGIVRDPFDRFVSAFKYYGAVWRDSRIIQCINQYNDPLFVYIDKPTQCEQPRMSVSSQLFYRMLRDFGFPLKLLLGGRPSLKKRLVDFIYQVRSEFDFIMVVEKFDESLILLRRLLGWKLEDLIYVKLNNNQGNNTVAQKISKSLGDVDNREKLRQLFSKRHKLEVIFYDAFKQLLEDALQEQDSEFHEELSFFRQVRVKVEKLCDPSALQKRLTVQANRWTSGFSISKLDCFLMNIDESSFTQLIRNVQNIRLNIF